MNSRLAPLSGIAFLAFVIGGAIYGGKPPGDDKHLKSPEQLTAAYAAHADKLMYAVFFMAIGLVFLLYFGSLLKTTLDAGTAPTQCLSRTAFAGVVVFVVGAATDLTLMHAMAAGAKDKVDPLAIQALTTYWNNDFIPFAIGILALMSASALSILMYGGLPKWLGWLAALIAVVGIIPKIGFFAFPAAGVWILLASITMMVQAGKTAAGPPPM
jgi:hypothetical protein